MESPSDQPTTNPSPTAQHADFLLQFFRYEHLPPKLQAVSQPFCQMAEALCEVLPKNPEKTMALRKLLEAKDCAVRAVLCT